MSSVRDELLIAMVNKCDSVFVNNRLPVKSLIETQLLTTFRMVPTWHYYVLGLGSISVVAPH